MKKIFTIKKINLLINLKNIFLILKKKILNPYEYDLGGNPYESMNAQYISLFNLPYKSYQEN